jgi:polyhydroxyalkanoate synthesis repressor PhaR
MSTSGSGADDPNPVIIKKYANRRLYDTESSSYITLDHLSAMTRAGREFKVVDAKTGEDITHNVLTQIIMEEETRGTTLLPVSFLRQIIALYGDQMQAMVPYYLEASMEMFRRNQEQMRAAVQNMLPGGMEGGIEALTRQNMAMMKAATDIWMKSAAQRPAAAPDAPPPASPAPPRAPLPAHDLRSLKEQLDALQARIERLAGE